MSELKQEFDAVMAQLTAAGAPMNWPGMTAPVAIM